MYNLSTIRVDKTANATPMAHFDFVAYFSDLGEDSPHGYGATAQEAVDNLKEEVTDYLGQDFV